MGALKRMPNFFLLIVIITTSCAGSKSFVSFEILEPAAIDYPETVRSVGYLNRAPFSRDAFAKVNQEGLDRVSLYIVDTTICNNIRLGFFEGKQLTELTYLEEIPYFNERRSDTINKSSYMSISDRNKIFNENPNKLDALVVLEYYQLKLNKSYPSYDFMLGDFIEEFSLSMDILWRVYVRDREKPVDEYLQQDTLYYVNRQSMPSSSYLNPTDVLRDGSQEFGFNYGLRHIPKWKEVSRVIFRGGSEELKEAAEFTDRGEWDKAAKLWVPLINDIDHKIAAKACHNLAVRYELLDDLQTSSNYANRATELWENNYTIEYKKQLDKRILDQERVLKQVR